MNRAIFSPIVVLLLLSACGSDNSASESAEAAFAAKSDATLTRTTEVQSPVQITYRVIGTPIVGSPVAVELQLKSSLGATPYRLTYRVNDPTAMQMPESQSAEVSISPTSNDERVAQQVTVVPLREGRLYLNVAAVIESESGSMQTVTAIPIQVGPAAPREILENGTVITDDDGGLVRTMPAKED